MVEFRRNALLAAGSSLVRSGIGNPINTAWFTAEIPISAAFNAVYTNLAKGIRKAGGGEPIDKRTRYQGELVYHMIGIAKGYALLLKCLEDVERRAGSNRR